MLSGNGLEVGSVFARIGALFDDDGFDKYRRAIREVREDAKKEVRPDLEADFNSKGFDQFGRALKEAHVEGAKEVKPDLGADYNARGFDLFSRAIRGARDERDVSTDLKADVDMTGFRKYDAALKSARNESDIVTRAGLRTKAGFIGVGKSAAGAAVGLLGAYGLVEGVRQLYGAYRDSEKVGRQTEAVIKSTGGEANVTADHVAGLADKFSHLAAADDEMVQSGENVLLTFTNVRNEVGKGNNVFDQATLAVLNMSVALDQDMKSGAIQLGKALNDPIKGITALSRVGVSFTEETKERITALVEEGKTLQAQKIILKEINKEFGGSAKAAGAGASGFDKLGVAVENLEEKIGGKFAPTLSRWGNSAAEFIDSLTNGEVRASKFGRSIDDAVNAVEPFGDELSGIGKVAVRVFGGIRDIVSRTFGKGTGVGRDLLQIGNALRDFGQWALRAYTTVAKRALPGILTAFRGAAQVIRGVVRVIAGILTLDFGKAWEGVEDIFGGGLKMIGGTLRAGTAPIRSAVAAIGGVIGHGFSAAWSAVKTGFKNTMDFVLGGLSSFLGTIGDVSDFAAGLPGVGNAFDGVNDSVHDAQESIDDFRESLRKSDDTQKDAIKAAKRHVDALKEERRELRRNSASNDDLRRNKRALRQAQDDLTSATRKGGAAMKQSGDRAHGMGQQLKGLTGRTKDARKGTRDLQDVQRDKTPADTMAKGLRRLIRGSGNFQDALSRATTFAKDATNKALTGFGAKPLSWVVEAVKDVGDLLGFARGGFIGRRGQKGKDKRLVLAGDGEAFFNGDQIPFVENALRKTYGVNLPQFFGGKRWRPHSQTRGYEHGGVVDEFASGGQVFPHRSYPGLSGDTDFNPSLGLALSRMATGTKKSIYVTSGGRTTGEQTGLQGGPNPAAAPGTSHHEFVNGAYAADIAPGYEVFGGVAGRYGLTFPLLGIGEPWHIELADGPTGGGVGHIPRMRIKGPDGPQKTILQNAADKMVKQANAYLAKAGGSVGGGLGAVPPGSTGGGSPAENQALGRRMMLSAGQPSGQWPALQELWTRESGWEETAQNPTSTAYGIPQNISPETYPTAGQPGHSGGEAAAAQIGWGLDYIQGRYGSPSAALAFHDAHNWYSEGGVVEAFGKGGQVGKGKGGKASAGPAVAVAEPAGPVTVASMGPLEAHLGRDGGKFVAHAEGKLSSLEADYTYWDRRFNLSEEEFIVEGDDGSPVLNREAIKRRVGELRKLLAIRKAIVEIRNREIAFAKKTIELLRPVIAQLKKGLSAAKSKEAREKWRDAIQKYTGQLTNWKGQLGGWQTDRRERVLDRDEVQQQIEALMPGGSVEGEYDAQMADFLTGLEGGDEGGSESGDGGKATPEEIAEAAKQQLAEFQSQRSSLYGEFGSNFVPAGTVPFQTPQQQAAGMAFYGAAGGSAPTSLPELVKAASGGKGGKAGVEINVEQNFAAPPPDAHTWTKSVIFELGAQL